MNRVALVMRTPAVALHRFDHPPGEHHCDPEQETAACDSINFVAEGAFDVRVGRSRWSIAPGMLFVAARGMEFSCTHHGEQPTDRCLSLSYAEQTVEDLRVAGVDALRPPAAAVTSRQRFLEHRLEGCAPGEEIRLELLAAALYESLGTTSSARPMHGDLTAQMRRVERAMELIDSRFDQPLLLRDLARVVGLSPFHFARAFTACVGMPPHRYLTAVRLRHAVHRLEQGASVTHTCYDVGFSSLSHFVTTFRQRFGVSASEVKRGARVTPMRATLAASVRRH